MKYNSKPRVKPEDIEPLHPDEVWLLDGTMDKLNTEDLTSEQRKALYHQHQRQVSMLTIHDKKAYVKDGVLYDRNLQPIPVKEEK